MNTRAPDIQENPGLGSMMIPTIAVIGEILVNCSIIWFLLIDFPAKCALLAAETAGRQTCDLEAGAYVVATISVVMILGGHLFPREVEFPEERISIRSILIWPEFDQFLVHPYYSAVIFFNQTLIDPEKNLDRNQNRDEKF